MDSCIDFGSTLGGLVSHCIFNFISFETSILTCYILIYMIMLKMIHLEVVQVTFMLMHNITEHLA